MKQENRLPVFFIGHGAPNILLQQDPVLDEWKRQVIPVTGINRIMLVSAHWETSCFTLGGNQLQETIHDFYGFPNELYEYRYTPPSDSNWAEELAKSLNLEVDQGRGLDHGSWVPLTAMFPDEKIPVSHLSVSPRLGCEAHFELGKKLAKLRQQGVLIITSGVIVHNLRALNWNDSFAVPQPWAKLFMNEVQQAIDTKNWKALFEPHQLQGGDIAVPSLEHYLPLLIALGASQEEPITVFADVWRYGNLSQHSLKIG